VDGMPKIGSAFVGEMNIFLKLDKNSRQVHVWRMTYKRYSSIEVV